MADARSPKKPAHEVILDQLERIQQEYDLSFDITLDVPIRTDSDQLYGIEIRAAVLTKVLCLMVIPEKERGNVLARLQRIDWSLLLSPALMTTGEIRKLIIELIPEVPVPPPAA
ncbi:MAG: hypothetical protein Q7N87_03295 [Candidatus Uhrbacteria bacterium]|nr:hypothetical protein [Candidatus Uhrbacteria bacterium]